MPSPLVSVLIDTYNHSAFIDQAIESVLAQDFPASEMEILVVDDGSTDDTAARILRHGPRVRLLSKPNGGQASAFNFGIPRTFGQIVAFLDGDDWWAPEKLRIVTETFAAHPEIGAVGHGFWQLEDSTGKSTLIVPDRTYRVSLQDPAAARLFSHLRCFLGTSRFAARRPVLERLLPIPESLTIEADEFMFTLAAALDGAIVLNQPLFTYRLHGGNLYQMKSNDRSRQLRKLSVLESLVEQLPPRLRTLGTPAESIAVLLEPIAADALVSRLILHGGWPWETFHAERATARITYRDASFSYRVFKSALLALALVLPPKTFYALKAWYAGRGLHRVRAIAGNPTPAAPIVQSFKPSIVKRP